MRRNARSRERSASLADELVYFAPNQPASTNEPMNRMRDAGLPLIRGID
jgi:hypothetical protein